MGSDARELPRYSAGEVARVLDVPRSAVQYWTRGRRLHAPAVEPPVQRPARLSFVNLVELHVLAAIRRRHPVSLPRLREALDALAAPAGDGAAAAGRLADARLAGAGLEPFVERYGASAGVSPAGRIALRVVLGAALRRVERDAAGRPTRLYPFTRGRLARTPLAIAVDPERAEGRPVVAGTDVETAEIARRFKLGATLDALAREHGRPPGDIEEAVRFELRPGG